jgi:hypothetical protein
MCSTYESDTGSRPHIKHQNAIPSNLGQKNSIHYPLYREDFKLLILCYIGEIFYHRKWGRVVITVLQGELGPVRMAEKPWVSTEKPRV